MHTDNKSLWHKIKYRYVYIGDVQKDGKLYKKYKKESRLKTGWIGKVIWTLILALLAWALFELILVIIAFLAPPKNDGPSRKINLTYKCQYEVCQEMRRGYV